MKIDIQKHRVLIESIIEDARFVLEETCEDVADETVTVSSMAWRQLSKSFDKFDEALRAERRGKGGK